MHKNFLVSGLLIAAISVVLGAFAAHSLKQIFSSEIIQIFETAVKYQFYHAFALVVTGILFQTYPGKILQIAGNLFITGVLLFSGSLYALCFIKHAGINALWVGAITPLGGLCFIAGWLLVAWAVAKNNNK